MNIAGAILLGVTLAWVCLQRAGVEPPDWNPCALAIALIGAIYFLLPRPRIPRLNAGLVLCLAVVLGVAAFQLAPLPLGLVRILSPARAEMLQAAAPAAGGLPRFAPLSAAPYLSAEALLTLAAYVVIFLVVRQLTLRLDRFPWALAWPIVVVATLEAVIGFLQAHLLGDLRPPVHTTAATTTRACSRWSCRFPSCTRSPSSVAMPVPKGCRPAPPFRPAACWLPLRCSSSPSALRFPAWASFLLHRRAAHLRSARPLRPRLAR